MKRIEAKDQVALGPGRGLRLALTSMSYRLFRSSITVAILALAVAFLVHMVTHGILAQQTQKSAWEELKVDRDLGERLTRLVNVDTETAIYDQLHAASEERLVELEGWSGSSRADFEGARETARRLNALGTFLLDLPTAAQAVLLSDLTPVELFSRLEGEHDVEGFSDNLDRLSVRLPDLPRPAFRELMIEARPRMMRIIHRIGKGHEGAIQRLETAYPDQSASELVIDLPPGFVDALQGAGFVIDARTLLELQTFARREAELQRIEKLLLDSEVRATVARQTRLAPGDVSFDALLEHIDDRSSAGWLTEAMRAADSEFRSSPERLLALLHRARRERRLLDVAGDGSSLLSVGVFGLSERNQWLIALSFLVCVVGVANAMLMSVTERFTEIATMKCLGAMDRFVMLMFVFEAVVQGVIGGLIGVVVGILLALLRGFVEFGTLLSQGFAAGADLALGVLLSLLVGIALAALAAVGPSWIAARLPPMEAMRVD